MPVTTWVHHPGRYVSAADTNNTKLMYTRKEIPGAGLLGSTRRKHFHAPGFPIARQSFLPAGRANGVAPT